MARMLINFKTSQTPGARLDIKKSGAGWSLWAGENEVEQVKVDDTCLGLDHYKVIVKDDGVSATVVRFADLHRHSDNSLMDGVTPVSVMVKRTEYAGALTDHGNMYGFLEYYKGMMAAGKHPIIGFEAYQEDLLGKLNGNHLILLAKNQQGYKNLLKLTSESFNYFHYKPHVTWEMLEKYHEGVICTSACLGGIVPSALMRKDTDTAELAIKQFLDLFGEDFYLEIQRHGIDGEAEVNEQLLALGRKHGIPVIATTDSHYPDKEDAYAHEIELCLQTKKTMNEPHYTFSGTGYHLYDSEEMEGLFADSPEVLDNTLRLAEKCEVKLKLKDVNLPHYTIPKGFDTPMDYFRHLCEEGFQRRFKGKPQLTDPKYKERFDYEMAMIEQMGFESYFIIVWDFIDYARRNNIYVGPGRGSAAGSLLAYCMGITDMDPIRFNLLFERFLNPERVSWPDIDTDIEHVGRPKVIDYITKKYGAESVCRIVTFGTQAAKMVIKDVARVLGYSPSWANSLAKLIPSEPHMTIAKAMDGNPELRSMYQNDADAAKVINVAKKLEGNKRHASQHACFIGGTPVLTAAGEKPIEKIKVGEWVMTHAGRWQRVVKTMVRRTKKLYIVLVNGRQVTVTGNHPLLVANNGEWTWKQVKDINMGKDTVVCYEDGHFVESPVWIGGPVPIMWFMGTKVYNLTVENDSSYIAGGIVAHNCGLVIAPGEVSNFLPTSMEKDKETGERSLTSQVTMTEVEDLSLIKMDLLGLKNLTAIHEVIDTVKRTRGIDTIYQDLPLDDRDTYVMLSKGMTGGVFQLEGEGMTNNVIVPMLADVETLPDNRMDECFERLIAAVALYRPGPMDEIPHYIEGMKDISKIHYLTPELESILRPTYGVTVYQEQVIQIVQKLAGYSLGRADVVRKAVGKKKHDVMEAEKEVFLHGNKDAFNSGKDAKYVPGCVENGIAEPIAQEIWSQMEKFASYAFNRSHAACYAWIASITAYMSCHWPEEFFCAMMNAFGDISTKVKGYMALAVKRGIKILPPDINKSEDKCTVEDGCIRLGFHALANLNKAGKEIITERQKNGQFKDYPDFYNRITRLGKKPTKKVLCSLIYAGALDGFGLNKHQLVNMIPLLEDNYKKEAVNWDLGQLSLFSAAQTEVSAPVVDEFKDRFLMEQEREAIGFYLTKHPVDELLANGRNHDCISITDMISNGLPDGEDEMRVTTYAILRDIKSLYTKNDEEMFFLTAEDRFNEIQCVLFPKRVSANKHRLEEGALVKLTGYFRIDEQRGPQLQIQDILSANEERKASLSSVIVTIRNREEQDKLMKFVREHPGRAVVQIKANNQLYPTNRAIQLTPGVMDFLKEHFASVET